MSEETVTNHDSFCLIVKFLQEWQIEGNEPCKTKAMGTEADKNNGLMNGVVNIQNSFQQ